MLRIDEIFVQNFISHKFGEEKDRTAYSEEKKESFARGIIENLKNQDAL